MMNKMGGLRQHLGPRGIPSFNGVGGPGGGSSGSGSSGGSGGGRGGGQPGDDDHGGFGPAPGTGYGGPVGGVAGFGGGVMGADGTMGTGYGFGGLGVSLGGITSAGDFAGEVAADMGFGVDEPTGVRGGNPSNFGGGSQGNDVGGSMEGVGPPLARSLARPMEGVGPPLASVIHNGMYGDNPMLAYQLAQRYGMPEGGFGDMRFQRMLDETGQRAAYEQEMGQRTLPKADIFRFMPRSPEQPSGGPAPQPTGGYPIRGGLGQMARSLIPDDGGRR